MVLIEHLSNLNHELQRLLKRIDSQSSALPDQPDRRQKQTRLSDEAVDRLIADEHAGASIAQLSRDYDIHRTTVMAWLDRRGARQPRGEAVDSSG